MGSAIELRCVERRGLKREEPRHRRTITCHHELPLASQRLFRFRPVQPNVAHADRCSLESGSSPNSATLPLSAYDGIYDGMALMSHRTTFALDQLTAKRLRRLAALWRVSQAEVVRRAVAEAEATALAASKPDPVALLRELHAAGEGLDIGHAEAYLSEVREERRRWRGE